MRIFIVFLFLNLSIGSAFATPWWYKLDGIQAQDIAQGGIGGYWWAVSTDQKIYQRTSTGNPWQQVTGSAKRIAIYDQYPWITKQSGYVFHGNASQGWDSIPLPSGVLAIDIGVGTGNNNTYIVTRTNTIYKYSGTWGSFPKPASSNPIAICVAGSKAWLATSGGSIYKDTTGTGAWKIIGQNITSKDIGVDNFNGQDYPFAIGGNLGPSGGYQIYQLVNNTWTWIQWQCEQGGQVIAYAWAISCKTQYPSISGYDYKVYTQDPSTH